MDPRELKEIMSQGAIRPELPGRGAPGDGSQHARLRAPQRQALRAPDVRREVDPRALPTGSRTGYHRDVSRDRAFAFVTLAIAIAAGSLMILGNDWEMQ